MWVIWIREFICFEYGEVLNSLRIEGSSLVDSIEWGSRRVRICVSCLVVDCGMGEEILMKEVEGRVVGMCEVDRKCS